RWFHLAVRAFTKRYLAFSEVERQDERWRIREELLLAEVEREALGDMHRMLHRQETAAAQYEAGSDVFRYYYDRARQQYDAFVKLFLPYMKVVSTKDLESLAALWKQVFGDPDDPELAAEIDKTRAYLRELKESQYGQKRTL
ncbi:unnamed protein product, partial [marine sediment metagenome]